MAIATAKTLKEAMLDKTQPLLVKPPVKIQETPPIKIQGGITNGTANNFAQDTPAITIQKNITNTTGKTPDKIDPTNDIYKAITTSDYNKDNIKTTQTDTPPPTVTPEKATDNTQLINSQSDALAQAIKAQIAQRKQEIEARLSQLPEVYQNDRNASEVAKAKNARSIYEMTVNQGDRGGIGRQNALVNQTAGEQRLVDIDNAQKAEETALRNSIGKLMLDGDVQTAQLEAERLRNLIANNTNMNQENYNRQFAQEGRNIENTRFDKTFGLQSSGQQFGQNMDLAQLQDRRQETGFNQNMSNKTFGLQEQGQQFGQEMATKQYRSDEKTNSFNRFMAMNNYDLDKQRTESAIMTDTINRVGMELSNKLGQLKLDAFPEENRLAIENAKMSLENGNVDLAMKNIQKSNLDAKLKAEIAQTYEQINASKANTAQGERQLAISGGNLQLNRDEFNAKVASGAYDPKTENTKEYKNAQTSLDKLYITKVQDATTGAYIPTVVGDVSKIRENILTMGLTEEATKMLYSRYGIPLESEQSTNSPYKTSDFFNYLK